jgi:hypothetical protein
MNKTPFKIDIPPHVLADLQHRLEKTRWSYQLEGIEWKAGTDLDYLKRLVDYWRTQYDWRLQEAALNRFAHFTTELAGIRIHFIHERGKPREWADRFFNVQRWTNMPEGGHFAALEVPELLAQDLREWFRTIR